jgi:DNA-binding transcriptional LysR family regulator
MTTRRLPPLYPLRAFEAAARLSSFTLAAEELSISQSAVSHQVKKLEAYFGAQLFYRGRGFIRLTAEGIRVFAACESAFNQLGQVNDVLPEGDVEATLTLCSPPLFFNGWLLPRLSRFAREHPKIGFRFIHFSRGMRLTPNDVDIAIIWGDRIWDGFTGAKILDMAYAPIASPQLAAKLPKQFNPAVLDQTVLLHAFDHQGWASWLAAAGFPELPATTGWVFQEPGMMMEAAASGQGIALGPVPVMDDAIAAGRFVRIFEHTVHPATYFLGVSGRSADKPAVRLFWKWFSENVLPTA